MTITDIEFTNIVNAAVEKILLEMPNVIGNLMSNHAITNKLNHKFYKDYPKFAENKDLVRDVIEQLEGANPATKYEKLLDMSVPEIENRLNIINSVNLDTPASDKSIKIPKEITPNGVI